MIYREHTAAHQKIIRGSSIQGVSTALQPAKAERCYCPIRFRPLPPIGAEGLEPPPVGSKGHRATSCAKRHYRQNTVYAARNPQLCRNRVPERYSASLNRRFLHKDISKTLR